MGRKLMVRTNRNTETTEAHAGNSTEKQSFEESLIWDKEYGSLQVIPSSTRESPSKALLLFSEILHFENKKVLDAGCGIGRNSIFLAQKGCEVHAVDISKVALNKLKSAAKKAGVEERIIVHNVSIDNKFPFEENSFDIIIDSYVFCHFIDQISKQKYRDELYRLIRDEGYVFISLFSVDDRYYKEFIELGNNDNIVVDKNNGITKQLYTEECIKEFFSVKFTIHYFVKFEFIDLVLGKPYMRSILALILKK
jgi:SAM-dependent methyltransferase